MAWPVFNTDLPRVLLALAIGAGGGALAVQVGMPLPWMLGSMLATTVAAISGAPVAGNRQLRSIFIAVLGVMLGSAFTPEIVGQLASWAISLSVLVVYTALAGLLGVIFFQRVAGYDPVTSYFAAMPGGLSEMIFVGEEMGGDARVISLIHATRIILVVMILSFAFQTFAGYAPEGQSAPGPSIAGMRWLDLVILTLSGIVGFLLAHAVRIPAAALVGPMLISAVVHLAGLSEVAPPGEIVAAAQVVVGSTIGCRFAGTTVAAIRRIAAWAFGATVLLLTTTLAFAWAVDRVTGIGVSALTLAYAPGGLAEMSLVALALGIEAAFVATHHIVRIFLIVVLAPLAFRLNWTTAKRPPPREP